MLFKALRIRSGFDMYNLEEHVLKTLYHDTETHRVRDIKPGDKVKSVWDGLHEEHMQFVYGVVEEDTPDGLRKFYERPRKVPRNLFYNRTDELEDEILFPEERRSENLNPLEIGKIEPIRTWEDEGFSLRKFVEGRDLDSDWLDSDWSEGSELDIDEDGFESDEEDLDDGEEKMTIDNQAPPTQADEKPVHPVDIVRAMNYSDQLRPLMERLMLRDRLPKKVSEKPESTYEEFMAFLDREKARSMYLSN